MHVKYGKSYISEKIFIKNKNIHKKQKYSQFLHVNCDCSQEKRKLYYVLRGLSHQENFLEKQALCGEFLASLIL